jgi:hypothetical protein
VKALDETDSGKDESRAHEQCPENSPKQHAMLVLLGNGKVAEDYEEDEKIIDAEREFEYITGNEFDSYLATLPEKNQSGKGESQSQPDSTSGERLTGTYATAAVKDAEVQHQHADREKIEEYPEINQVIADGGLLLPA